MVVIQFGLVSRKKKRKKNQLILTIFYEPFLPGLQGVPKEMENAAAVFTRSLPLTCIHGCFQSSGF